MNDIFKLFKKRAQSGKGTNITDVIKDLNEKEQNEIMGTDGVGKFERGSKSYLSISKSGRLKSKKSQSSRALGDDLFNPVSSKLTEIASRENRENNIHSSSTGNHNLVSHNGICRNPAKKPAYELKRNYDQNSDNADSSRTSSTSSSFCSSFEEIPHHSNGYMRPQGSSKKQAPKSSNYHQSSTLSNRQTANYLQATNNNRNNMVTSAGIRNNMRYMDARSVNTNSSHHLDSNNINAAYKRF